MQWCVYFIAYGNKDNSPVKVGYTSDIDMRITNLQTCCPYRLKLLMTIPCESKSMAAKLERFLHNRLKKGLDGIGVESLFLRRYMTSFIPKIKTIRNQIT